MVALFRRVVGIATVGVALSLLGACGEGEPEPDRVIAVTLECQELVGSYSDPAFVPQNGPRCERRSSKDVHYEVTVRSAKHGVYQVSVPWPAADEPVVGAVWPPQ